MNSSRTFYILFFFLSIFNICAFATDRYGAIGDSIRALRMSGKIEDAKGLLAKLRAEVESNPLESGRQTLYKSWGDIVASHFNRNEIIEAVEEVQKMQDFVSLTNDDLGMAYVDVTYGGIYTYNFEESIRHLRRALDYWKRTGNRDEMQYTYYMLSREALGVAETTDSTALRQRLYGQVLDYADNIERLAMDTEELAGYPIQISEYLRMLVNLANDDQEKATTSFDRINSWWTQGKVDPRIKGMMAYVMADYLIRYGNLDYAAALIAQINLERQRLDMEIRLCKKRANYTRAFDLQKQLDKLNLQRANQLQQVQLAIANAGYNNLRLEREKHQLEMDRVHRTMMLNILGVIAVALLAVLIALIISQRRILQKNRDLVHHIQALEEQERKTQSLALNMPEKLSPEEQLFLKIEKLLEDNIDILTDPALDRDTLAAHLGTNRTYIAQAIAACADGISVSEYVNRLRLQYALYLLSKQPQMSIDEVATVSGFGSRSRFHHLFVAQYDMTPGQFRKASKG